MLQIFLAGAPELGHRAFSSRALRPMRPSDRSTPSLPQAGPPLGLPGSLSRLPCQSGPLLAVLCPARAGPPSGDGRPRSSAAGRGRPSCRIGRSPMRAQRSPPPARSSL